MAEDIRDMFVSGTVADYKKHTGADLYILRSGRELTDDAELCSVGGLDQAFSLYYREPALAVKIVSGKKLTREIIDADRTIRFLRTPENRDWDHFESPKYFHSDQLKFAQVVSLPFFEIVNVHWKGRDTGYIDEPYKLGPYEVFRNGKDGVKVPSIPEDELVVVRNTGEGQHRVFWPRGGKNFVI